MKKLMKKILSVSLCLALSAAVLSGCGPSGGEAGSGSTGSERTGSVASGGDSADTAGNTTAELPDSLDNGAIVKASPEMYANTDLSKDYTVNMYLIGDKPNDWEKVLGLINEYFEPYNTKLAVTFMSWSDYETMYSLVLAGGEQVDLIFTAPWCYMFTESAKGSFYELKEDFIKDYMPLTSKYQAPESWSETTIEGKIIAVSSNDASPMGKIVAVRQDLMEKYGMSELKNWADYKEYMLTIAEKETPESGIYALAASADNNELWDVYRQQFDSLMALDNNFLDMMYKYTDGIPAKEDIKLVYEYDEFRDYCYDMKEMADAGCWSRSALTNTVSDDDAFGNLQGASIAWNGSVFTYMKQAEQTEGVECMAYDLTTDNLVAAEAYSNNDMAITAGSGNPERTAMVLDMLKFDTALNRYVLLGIEGEHYSIDDKGFYTKLPGNTEYPTSTVSASWAIKNGNLEESGTPERETAITDSWDERVVMNPTITFVFDDSNVKSYMSAVISVLGDYVPMLELGLVEDVDSTLDEMLQKCEDSGLQNIYDEFYSQYDAWLAQLGE